LREHDAFARNRAGDECDVLRDGRAPFSLSVTVLTTEEENAGECDDCRLATAGFLRENSGMLRHGNKTIERRSGN